MRTVQFENSVTPYQKGLNFFASILQKIMHENNGYVETPGITGGQAAINKLWVLLADDDSDDRELFLEAVKEIGILIEVCAVADGVELMRTLNNSGTLLPNVLFLDLNMPGKNGIECLKEIKGDGRLSSLPVVIYSTSGNQQDIIDTHLNGASFYIRKPNSYFGLTSVIKKIFSLDLEMPVTCSSLDGFVIRPDL